jgi:ATP-dependent NAD(P)H-hydrate dehydratase
MTCRQEVAKFFPELTGYLHKGMLGRITVVGGCDQYTGAPYFAASAALRVGADLVSVLCTEEAAVPIKCYSPDIMVLGRLTKYAEHEAAQRLVSKADCVVIGTGLGLDPKILEVARNILIHRSSSEKKAIVVDGDGIMCVVRKPKLLQGNNRAILTPNAMEFRRLWEAIFPKEEAPPFDVTIEQKDQLEFVDPEFDPDTIATSKLARA